VSLAGHEKGGVEEEGGYFRRNHLVPVPKVRSLEELNELLAESAREDEQRVVGERTQTVGAVAAIAVDDDWDFGVAQSANSEEQSR
jgi:hypothetical protein